MNKKYILSVAAVGAALYGASFFVKNNSNPEQIFIQLDDNRDGNVTINELRDNYKEQHEAMDDNRDSHISFDEAEEEDRVVSADIVDTNDDNQVSFEEGFEIERERFKVADVDQDGKVSKAEFDNAVKKAE